MKIECQDKIEIDRLKRWLDLSKIIHYLKERQNEEGGFSFAVDLYPDIEVSGAEEPPPCALSDTDVNLSAHPAPIIQPWVLHQTANAEIIRAAFWLFSLTNIPHL